MVALSLPMRRRRVAPNGWYGLRTAATLADERVWYEANAKAGADLALTGYVLGLATLSVPGGLIEDPGLAFGLLSGGLVAVLVVSCIVRAAGARRHLAELNAAASGSEGR